MQSRKEIVICGILLAYAFLPVLAQDADRWLKLPDFGRPHIIRHRLNDGQQTGRTLRLKFETDPASPLIRKIRKFFPETADIASESENLEEIIDVGKSTILLEKMQIEADRWLHIASETIASATPVSSQPETLF
ncbi:MAG: hypothetical protein Kow0029_21940 [Candidatus Rifleibacteriota bacterium]